MRKEPAQLTNRHRNDRHYQEVEIGNPSELLEEILWQERKERVFGGDDSVLLRRNLLRFSEFIVRLFAANVHSPHIFKRTYAVALKYYFIA